MTLKKQKKLEDASLLEEKKVENVSRYRVKTIPAAGAILKPEDRGEQQLSLLDDKT
jgi:DNA gyrase subunit A